MKDVIFKGITISNFMSIGEVPVYIPFGVGLNFLTGINEDADSFNGVGKTTIINAFYYCLFSSLYGDNSGKLKNADIINNVTGGSPVVKIDLSSDSVDYSITRSSKPSKCVIERDGNIENQNFSISETNEEIVRIVAGDSEVYSNIIIMDSDSRPFLLKEPSKKTKFIENVFSLGVFSRMHKDAVKEYGEKNKQLSISTAEKNQVSSFLERLIQNKNNFESDKDSRIKKEQDLVLQYNKEYEDLKSKVPQSQDEEINKINEEISTIKERLQKGETAKTTYSHKIDTVNIEIRNLRSKLTDPADLVCRTCKRPLSSHNQEDIEKENKSINQEISKLQDSIKETKETLNKIVRGINTLNSKVRELSLEVDKKKKLHEVFLSQESKFKELESKIQSSENKIESIKTESNPYIQDISKYETDLEEKEKEEAEIEEEVEVLNYVKYLCSPEGVKAHIISKIVNLFNATLQSFLIELESEFKIEFNEFFEETITNSAGADVSYHSLSGGERKRLSLACIFAFREIRRLQSGININVVLMDELLDSALCSNGISNALDILDRSAKEHSESIFIITHKMDQIQNVEANTFTLVKKNKVTSLMGDI